MAPTDEAPMPGNTKSGPIGKFVAFLTRDKKFTAALFLAIIFAILWLVFFLMWMNDNKKFGFTSRYSNKKKMFRSGMAGGGGWNMGSMSAGDGGGLGFGSAKKVGFNNNSMSRMGNPIIPKRSNFTDAECAAPWDSSATEEVRALATVGSYKEPSPGLDKMVKQMNDTLTDAQLEQVMKGNSIYDVHDASYEDCMRRKNGVDEEGECLPLAKTDHKSANYRSGFQPLPLNKQSNFGDAVMQDVNRKYM